MMRRAFEAAGEQSHIYLSACTARCCIELVFINVEEYGLL